MRSADAVADIGVARPTEVPAPPPSATLPWQLPALSPTRVGVALGLAGVGLIPLSFGTFGQYIAGYAATFAILGLSIVVVTGYAGLISLMPFSFVGIGTFATGVAVAGWGWPFWLAVPLAALATVPVSALVGMASIRLKGLYLAIATLAFANAMGETLFDWSAFTGGQAGHTVTRPKLGPLNFSGDFAFYVLTLVAALLLVWAVSGLRNSRVGRAMLAVRDNEQEAQALGINVYKTKLLAFVIGGMIAGIGGAFYSALLTAVAPSGFKSPFVDISSLLLLGWVVIGGVHSAWGAFLGGTFLVVQQQVFQGATRLFAYVGAYQALLLVAFLLLRPGGVVMIIREYQVRIQTNPRRYIPRAVALFGSNIVLAYLVLHFGSE
jgi:branched-chain amino acid transport system permease protein